MGLQGAVIIGVTTRSPASDPVASAAGAGAIDRKRIAGMTASACLRGRLATSAHADVRAVSDSPRHFANGTEMGCVRGRHAPLLTDDRRRRDADRRTCP